MILRIAWRATAAAAILVAAAFAYQIVARAEPAELSGPIDVAVETVPIRNWTIGETVGGLVFLGGLELRSDSPYFGSLSGLVTADGGRTMLAVSDFGYWFAARLAIDGSGRPTAVEAARIAPIAAADIRPGTRKHDADAEGLAIRRGPGGPEVLVSFEAKHRILRFPLRDFPFGVLDADGVKLPGVPGEIRALWPGKGLEALAVAPAGSPLAGAVVAIGEKPIGEGDACPGWIIGGPRPGRFAVVRTDQYQITDAAFLPSGDLLILERRFNLLGIAARIRRIDAAALVHGARLDGRTVFEASGVGRIDNMEGLAVEAGADGVPIVTLISDDNGSILQRTLLLRFRLTAD